MGISREPLPSEVKSLRDDCDCDYDLIDVTTMEDPEPRLLAVRKKPDPPQGQIVNWTP